MNMINILKSKRGGGIKPQYTFISILVVTFICIKIFWSFCQGFRWPSDYVLTNHAITYIMGFVPRSLVGAIGYLFWGDKWYSWKYMSFIIMTVGGVFVIWILYETVKSIYKFNNFTMFIIVLMFSISPFAKYYLHEMGYYEQYGYIFCIALFYICKKHTLYRSIIIPAIFSFLVLLISESNIFLVVPIIFAFSFLNIINACDNIQIFKNIVLLLCTYIPHIIYCILIWLIKVPADLIRNLQNHDRDMINSFPYYNFAFREDVHWYMANDRSNADTWRRELHPIYIWCVAFTLLVIVFVGLVCYNQNLGKKLLFSYIISAFAVGAAAYLIVIVAWDLDRYFFNIYISVLFVSMFTVKYYAGKLPFTKQYIEIVLILIIAVIGMSSNRLLLFDSATYNNSWNEFMDTIQSRPVYNDEILNTNFSLFEIKKGAINYCIDLETGNEYSTRLDGWAYIIDTNLSIDYNQVEICVEISGKYYKCNKMTREDVKEAFDLSTDLVGYSVFYGNGEIGKICIIDMENKIIYK